MTNNRWNVFVLLTLALACCKRSTQAPTPQVDKSPLFSIEVAKKFGFIDKTGKVVISPRFDAAGEFSGDGLAWVKTDSRCGFIDKTGKEVIPRQFQEAGSFVEGLAPVSVAGVWGFVETSGKIVINPVYQKAEPFSQGRAAVKTDDRWGFIDRNGKAVITPKYDSVESFASGLAEVMKVDGRLPNGMPMKRVCGYVSLDGAEVVPLIYENCGSFSEGVASVAVGKHQATDLFGYINTSGQFVINPMYEEAADFSEGIVAVTPSGAEPALIDKAGHELCKISGAKAPVRFSSGLAVVELGDDKYGYMDKTCKVVISGLDSADDFSNGLASVTRSGLKAYIDPTGNAVWKAQPAQ